MKENKEIFTIGPRVAVDLEHPGSPSSPWRRRPKPGADSSGVTDDVVVTVVGGKVDGLLKSNLQLLALRFGLLSGWMPGRLEPSRRRRYIWIALGRLHINMCHARQEDSCMSENWKRTLACQHADYSILDFFSLQVQVGS